MKRFRFPLRPVAVLREHEEMRARETFAASVQAFVKAEQELAIARARVQALANELTEGRARQFSAATEIRAIEAYRRVCTEEVEAQQALVKAKQAMDERRLEYIEAHRRLEVVHRLEDKARATHRYETMREEQADFDDLATRRFVRRALNPTA